MAERPRFISTIRARGAALGPAMRYVLIASVTLAVVAMVWVFLRAPTATQPVTATTAGSAPARP